jgi:DNA adenine methylase
MIALPAIKHEYTIARPVLKWAGGKGQLLPTINQHLPAKLKFGAIKTYIEPFIGGGAMFFDLANTYNFERVFLFDVNPELIILYNVIKNDVEKLIAELQILQDEYFSSTDQSEFYYARRDEYNVSDKNIDANIYSVDFVRRSALTVFLNRTCFNGLFRVNSKNQFNVPMGRYKNPKICDAENLCNVSDALQNATIMQTDFATALQYADKDTFIYYDPPYRPIRETSNFNSYSVCDFDDAEQMRLRDVFTTAHAKGALQMLSNSDPTNYINDLFFDDLYKNFKINRVMAKRLINSKADGRDEIRELLITNYA